MFVLLCYEILAAALTIDNIGEVQPHIHDYKYNIYCLKKCVLAVLLKIIQRGCKILSNDGKYVSIFITKSFLTDSFFSPTPALSTISRPLSSYMCSITPETANVGSSYSRMRGPGIGCWFSDRSNCSHWSFEAAVLPINPNIYNDQW